MAAHQGMRKRVFAGAAILATSVALLGGLVGQQRIAVVLGRSVLSAIGFSLLIWLLFETVQRKLPDLFHQDGNKQHAKDDSPAGEGEAEAQHEPEGDDDPLAYPSSLESEAKTPILEEQQSPSLMRQIVKRYTPEQLSRAVRMALDKT